MQPAAVPTDRTRAAGAPRPTCSIARWGDDAHVRRSRAFDVDAHTQQLSDWSLHYDQLDCGRFEGEFTDVRLPGLQLFVERTTRRVRQRGHLLPDSCGLGTMIEGAGPLCVNGVPSGVGTLMACNATELDVCTPADCTLAGLVVDLEVLRDAARLMPELEPLLRPHVMLAMTPNEAALAPWRTLLTRTVHAALEQPALLREPRAQRQLRDDLLVTLIEAMTDAQRRGRVLPADARVRLVDRACELILAQPDDPPSLVEVCHRVGASPRKLGYCFQDVVGLSPARYLKVVRLNAVRRELNRAEDATLSVYDAAARWGFWHFGHFSADYKRQFSELPSETLRRARLRLGVAVG